MSGQEVRISRTGRALGLAVTLVLAGGALRAIFGPHEDWPFTSAPMFARYHARGEPTYYLEWWLLSPGAKRLLEPQRDLGIGELPLRRGYFARYYGSADERHPGGHHPGDTPAAFADRQTDYCRKLSRAWQRRGGAPGARFGLAVSERRAGEISQRRQLGSCESDGFRSAR